MTERNVAELIGWKYRGLDEWGGLPWYECDGKQVQPSTEPTADDLLAWLRDQDVWVRPHSDDLTDVPVRLSVYRALWPEHQDHSIDETVSAPTLLAALEAAVRAVAGQEGP